MKEYAGFVAIAVAGIAAIFAIVFSISYFSDDQEYRQDREKMHICLDAGKQWVENSCIK